MNSCLSTMTMNILPDPSQKEVDSYLEKWDTNNKYKLQERCLNLLFQNLCPSNSESEQILLKVSALNDFYSTNIFDTHSVAEHIRLIRPEDRISLGDFTIVDQIARITIREKTRHLYSFASKYCSHHNPEVFPIYDKYVGRMLIHFMNKDRFTLFANKEVKVYARFVEIIRAFQNYYSLHRYTLRQLDIYLWLAGKDVFSR